VVHAVCKSVRSLSPWLAVTAVPFLPVPAAAQGSQAPGPGGGQLLLSAVSGSALLVILLLSAALLHLRRRNRRLLAAAAERESALEKLRLSEQKYVGIFQLLPDMVGITRLEDGTFVEINRGFEQCTGWSKDEVINRSSLELGLWDAATRARAVEIVREQGHLEEYEFILTTKSGAARHAVMYLIPIMLEETPCLCFLARDITERKLLELRRDDDQHFLQTMLDSIPDMIFFKDAQSTYLGCNQSYASRYIGRPKRDIPGRRDSDIIPDRHLIARFVDSDRTALESGGTIQLEHELTLTSGKKALVEVLKNPFTDASGRIAGVIGIARDMTEHKRILAAITREKEAAQRYLDIAGVMFCALNRSGDIILMNRKGCQILGYGSVQELLGRNWFDVCLPPEVREKVKEVFALQLAGNLEPVEFFENEVVTGSGSRRLIAFHNTLLHDEAGVSGVLFSGEDITDRRLMQSELLKSQKLESLGVLAGGIAHDFNNILTAISGNISLARMDTDKTRPAHAHLDRAEKAIQRAADLARQLLVFTKGSKPVKTPTSLQQIVNDTMALALSGTRVQGSVEFPAPLHTIEADGGQISQSLHNIIINAVQAMPDGGTLIITGENVTLEAGTVAGLSSGPYVRLTIADTGCGIPEEDQKSIFDPYFTTKEKGNGLGLASTYAIIRNHGGHIQVNSAPGRGTTFTLLLPSLATPSAAPRQERETDVEPVQGDAVLVMDDDDMVRELATLTLERLGFSVTTCANGNDAISFYTAAKSAGNPFSFVIMDLTIPGGMGGVEACRRIRAIDPGARIVVSSGYSDDPVMVNHADYGFCAAIEKPYRAKDIFEALMG
jgi:PAS domain S-box-containing protein